MEQAHTSADIDGLYFREINPSELSKDRWEEVQTIREHFYHEVFNKRSPLELGYFLGRLSQASWNSPGLGSLRGSYDHPRVVAAFDERSNEMKGYMYTANNVSSKLPGILGRLERSAKLIAPHERFESKRYAWGREYVTTDPDRVGLMTVLGALSYKGFKEEQPATWYPWSEEKMHTEQLAAWGFHPDRHHDGPISEPIKAFGPHTEAAYQQRWVASSVQAVLGRFYQEPDTLNAVLKAQATMQA